MYVNQRAAQIFLMGHFARQPLLWLIFWYPAMSLSLYSTFEDRVSVDESFQLISSTKWPPIWQTTFSNASSSIKSFVFRFKFHWSLFVGDPIDNRIAHLETVSKRRMLCFQGLFIGLDKLSGAPFTNINQINWYFDMDKWSHIKIGVGYNYPYMPQHQWRFQ